MTPRERVRRLRLYYRSADLFRERLEDPSLARWLPWRPGDRIVELRFRSGRTMRIPARLWPLLPSACRLERLGAEFEFLEDAKRVRIDGLTLYSPLWARDEAAYYQEVLLDDAYGVKGRDLAGRVVVDVGAYVGDSSIAFARQGASVHAFEPSVAFCGFIRRNLAENGLAGRVHLHEVGLAERAEAVRTRHDRLNLVEGVSYALEHLPRGIELLKLDCEGAEYHLLGDPRFLDHLSPGEIRMEYHRGRDGVVGALERAGYVVSLQGPPTSVGLLSAHRKS
jgi:FkbM family methyltransferase